MLEKIFLLHEKFCHPNLLEIQSERQSRHLYDLVKMMDTPIEEQVIHDKDFYATLVEHRRFYVRLRGVSYDDLRDRKISFLPPLSIIESFREDYEVMRKAMIYGESPDFDTILEKLKSLNERLHT